MLQVTRWRPDTCGCILEYEWDSDETETQRVHRLVNVVNQCSTHLIYSLEDLLSAVETHNRTYNQGRVADGPI